MKAHLASMVTLWGLKNLIERGNTARANRWFAVADRLKKEVEA